MQDRGGHYRARVYPPITDTGASTRCPNCDAERLFPVQGMFGEEMKKHMRGEEGKIENRLECRSCRWLQGEGVRKKAERDIPFNPRGGESWGT